ncbi:MAG: HD domain-containing phosphohydrolase [Lachnospiraceae bacterium]|nr:HD domain-containing phosphohydrolase [Lachnospiraceae bacterium]
MSGLDIKQLLEIGVSLSSEKDSNRLLQIILDAAMDITDCDGGTLYINTEEGLKFKIMVTKSKGVYKGGNDIISLSPVKMSRSNVCSCAAIDKKLINLPDVYENLLYDFSGPRKYDAITGYKTKSMLVVPMEDDYGDVIGVLQLINAQDESGKIIPFNPEFELVISSLASQAAISLTKMNYAKEISETLDSFVRVMSTAIDARTPYNANHTRNMVRYGEKFINWLNGESKKDWTFTEDEKHQFLMSIWLHDVGKLVIPLEVMDKSSRLGVFISSVKHRFQVIDLLTEIALLNGNISAEKAGDIKDKLHNADILIEKANMAPFLNEELFEKIRELGKMTYEDENGEERPWLSPEELNFLLVRKGTLTPDERKIMESHVLMTSKMLDEMAFSKKYKKVPEWAGAHHELLNGEGYPLGLKGDEIPREVRLLTILDVFDALTARDRPYKAPMTVEKTLSILSSMALEGQIDTKILGWFEESRAWEKD